jgi:hypothetical protein
MFKNSYIFQGEKKNKPPESPKGDGGPQLEKKKTIPQQISEANSEINEAGNKTVGSPFKPERSKEPEKKPMLQITSSVVSVEIKKQTLDQLTVNQQQIEIMPNPSPKYKEYLEDEGGRINYRRSDGEKRKVLILYLYRENLKKRRPSK